MGRIEENRDVTKHFIEEAIQNPTGTFEQMIAWHLGAMNSFLNDISKSLAIIADKAEGSDKE